MKRWWTHPAVVVGLALGALLYGVLWGTTWACGIPHVRDWYQRQPTGLLFAPTESDGKYLCVRRLDSFDPENCRLPVKGTEEYYYGHYRSPAPFLVSMDYVRLTANGGYASRRLIYWSIGTWKIVHEVLTWKLGDPEILEW
jgi:hypothetical protein